MKLFDKKLKNNIPRYILQCGLATITLLIVLLFLNAFDQTTIIASLGASTFIIFTMPDSFAAKPRNFIGGYITGIAIGVINSLLVGWIAYEYSLSSHTIYIVFGAISVGTTMFLMVILDTEHPPAVGLSLGLVLNRWDYTTVLFIFSAVMVMYTVKYLLRNVLINLK